MTEPIPGGSPPTENRQQLRQEYLEQQQQRDHEHLRQHQQRQLQHKQQKQQNQAVQPQPKHHQQLDQLDQQQQPHKHPQQRLSESQLHQQQQQHRHQQQHQLQQHQQPQQQQQQRQPPQQHQPHQQLQQQQQQREKRQQQQHQQQQALEHLQQHTQKQQQDRQQLLHHQKQQKQERHRMVAHQLTATGRRPDTLSTNDIVEDNYSKSSSVATTTSIGSLLSPRDERKTNDVIAVKNKNNKIVNDSTPAPPAQQLPTSDVTARTVPKPRHKSDEVTSRTVPELRHQIDKDSVIKMMTLINSQLQNNSQGGAVNNVRVDAGAVDHSRINENAVDNVTVGDVVDNKRVDTTTVSTTRIDDGNVYEDILRKRVGDGDGEGRGEEGNPIPKISVVERSTVERSLGVNGQIDTGLLTRKSVDGSLMDKGTELDPTDSEEQSREARPRVAVMDKYESLGMVGEGSYGMVLKCRHKETGQLVAIKKFIESENDKMVKKIAMREIRMLKQLRHDNLVNLIEVFRRKKRLYLVFEFVDHTVLDDLERHQNGLGHEVSRQIIWQVLKGIEFCHLHNIIHRDVKPENILVSKSNIVKLCDFGFARTLAKPGEIYTDYVATRWYRAPELLVGDTNYGRAVDIWAIGCLLAELLTGDPLFPGDSDIDQLFHIVKCFGNLTPRHQFVFSKNPLFERLRLPTVREVVPLARRFTRCSAESIDFMQRCLRLDADERPTCSHLLKHDLFTSDCFHQRFTVELQKRLEEDRLNNPLLAQSQNPLNGVKTNAQKTSDHQVVLPACHKTDYHTPELQLRSSVANNSFSSEHAAVAGLRVSNHEVSLRADTGHPSGSHSSSSSSNIELHPTETVTWATHLNSRSGPADGAGPDVCNSTGLRRALDAVEQMKHITPDYGDPQKEQHTQKEKGKKNSTEQSKRKLPDPEKITKISSPHPPVGNHFPLTGSIPSKSHTHKSEVGTIPNGDTLMRITSKAKASGLDIGRTSLNTVGSTSLITENKADLYSTHPQPSVVSSSHYFPFSSQIQAQRYQEILDSSGTDSTPISGGNLQQLILNRSFEDSVKNGTDRTRNVLHANPRKKKSLRTTSPGAVEHHRSTAVSSSLTNGHVSSQERVRGGAPGGGGTVDGGRHEKIVEERTEGTKQGAARAQQLPTDRRTDTRLYLPDVRNNAIEMAALTKTTNKSRNMPSMPRIVNKELANEDTSSNQISSNINESDTSLPSV